MPDLTSHDDLALKKFDLLRRRLAAAGRTDHTLPHESPAAPDLLSFGQQRLWFLDRFAPGLALYNIPAAVRVQGPLNPSILERAFSELTRRHEVLRAVFHDNEGRPQQTISPHAPFALEVCDLQDVPNADREPKALRRMAQVVAAPFDLSRGPLLRAVLFRLSPTDHLLAIVAHHIVSDGASVELLIREITTLCLDFARARASSLKPLPCQYSAYARWQREKRERGKFADQLVFWRGALAGMPSVLELPGDFRRGPKRHRGAKLEYPLAPSLTGHLSAIAAAHDTTLFTVLLCAFQALLVRHTGVTDIVVGTPVNSRTRAEFEPLIGFFVNALVLRTDLSGDPPFQQALARTRRTVVEALSHQDLPFELLVQELNPARVLSQTPLFQVVFSFQPEPRERAAAHGLSFERVAVHLPVAKFDLSLYVAERNGQLVTIAEYDTALFTEPTIARLIRHYEALLQSAAERPHLPLSLLPLLRPEEQPILEGAARPLPPSRTIQAAFEQQVARTPAAAAVIGSDEVLTYAELDRRSNALAFHLCEIGVPSGGVVAVLLERSPRLLVGVLGILKAGASYLPLDPEQPAARIVSMLESAAPHVCLTERAASERLPALKAETPIVLLDTLDLTTDHTRRSQSSDGAYVMFTSGSTGKPKGVVVGQAAVLNLLLSIGEELAIGSDDRLLAITTAGFDIASLEWFLPLVHGGTVVLASASEARDGVALARRLAADAITVLQATPATWQMLLAAGWTSGTHLKALCGGEALPIGLARELTRRASDVWNVYGPTETTIWSMIWRVPRDVESISLGRPIANTTVVLLDRDGALVPPGTPGELHIGGMGVAREYLGLPALTGEKFVPDRFSSTSGARLYRTGDVARVSADGGVEFIGRIDRQFKIRGQRVEPGEIEAALMKVGNVRQAAVIPRRSATGDLRTVAFIAADGEPPLGDELRRLLRQSLPDYMVPGEFVFLPDLPLNQSGKIDRRALEQREVTPAATDRSVPAANETEELLIAIWAQVLERDRIGATDNFFDLGGHSLLAAQVLARVRSLLAIDVPLWDLFEAPTVRGLAGRIAVLRRGDMALQTVAARVAGAPAPTALSFAQERLYFLSRLDPGFGAYNLVFAARFHSRLDPARLDWCFSEIVRRHEVFRTRFVETVDGPQALVEPRAAIQITVTDASTLTLPEFAQRLDSISRQQAARPFDLTAPPLARAELVHADADTCVLFLTLHHLIADGWSIEIITRELASLYRVALSNQDSGLTEPLLQYSDYANWQRQHLTPTTLDSRLTFWKQQLIGAATEIDFVTDRLRHGSSSDSSGAHLHLILPATTAASARAFARQHGATLFMTLLASWEAYLHRWTGSEDFLIGTPMTNRLQPELESVLGMFANTVVLRADLRDNPSFEALLARVRRTTLDGIAHQDLPFEMLVEALAPRRDVTRTPLFQTMFMLQHRAPADSQSGWEPLRLETGVSRFDLTLAIIESAGEITADIEYCNSLFERASVERAAEQWQELLCAALAAPTEPISRLPLGDDSILARTSEPRHPTPVIQRIEGVVASTPNALAIVSDAGSLTYRDLTQRIASCSRRLREAGVRPESYVPVEARRDAETVATILAVLAVGAAYVPIEPTIAAERLTRLLRAVGAEHCWRGSELVAHSDSDAVPRFAPQLPESAAYVIFTSGSTGAPKGVVVQHQSLSHYTDAAIVRFALQSFDRVLQFSNLTFDASVEEIFPTLAAGATLVLATPEIYTSVNTFLQYCGRHRVTVLDLPTAFWHEIVSAMRSASLALPDSVRLVIVGGEAARPDRLAVWQVLAPHVELVNTYGPTETTVVATAWTLTGAAIGGWDPARRVPIGEGMPGVRIYLLDQHLAPVPPNMPGEIFVGGAGVARGYLGDPRSSAERFLPDPFFDTGGARMYRTGDRARVNSRKELEFLGRRDRQLKVRGFRVEPAEVETVLSAHPAVEQCAVIPGEDGTDALRLIACVVSNSTDPHFASELREYLNQLLPSYLVPAAFVFATTIPRTSSGKIDHAAIASMAGLTGQTASAPSTDPLVDLLTGVWSEALGTRAHSYANFFDLGGHSLLILHMTATLREVLGVDVPVRVIFDAPTPASLAAWIRAGSHQTLRLPPLNHAPRDSVPLSIAQENVWEAQRALPGYAGFNMNVASRVNTVLDPQILADALNALARRHPMLASRVVEQPTGPPQLVRSDRPLEVDFFDQASFIPDEREATTRELVEHLRRSPFDLTKEPPLRVWLVRLSANSSAVLISLHHIAGDALSVNIFVDELIALYGSQFDGEPPLLAPIAATYGDFAVWQRRTLAEGGFAPQIEFWRETLRPPFEPINLPQARPLSGVDSFDVARERRLVPWTVVKPLFERARRERVTPYMAVLATTKALICTLSGTQDIRLATMAANRSIAGTEPLIGLFANTLVLRTSLNGEPNFRELMARVRDSVLAAFDHQELPFETLLQALEADGLGNRTALAQIMFLWQYETTPDNHSGRNWAALPLFGRDEPRPNEMIATKFDIVWECLETRDGLDTLLTYRTERYNAEAIRSLLSGFERFLANAGSMVDRNGIWRTW